ncbi:epoxyqueuosine reductase [Thermosediminibacter oceani]|uniref:4Fe-4S ferredoxin iron-sulfur binding domain-containing protein n=1 Tax=Thermosediminibacter oceani (strain ATCC BAA-1034 / DSM 16646 / JW/IW-1228P) TaxID=555079 RepID=D9S1V7_THEOJ|nr:epoxyqueuosine reductase [Thermosediminibacter oceani]ADL07384.1 4Fe-4S ferredoxin iron-sulfur binding domain-containing protein [Thermosediminibacter oceani DSM 16646]
MERWEELKNKIIEWGGSDVGFSRVEDFLPESHKHLKWAVTVVFHLSDQIMDDISDGPTLAYFHHYQTANALLDHIALRASSLIQEWGYRAMPVPASQIIDSKESIGFFQHKTAATRAGLGWIGKSALLVTKKFGPRVRLATILTDMPLPEGTPVEESGCGSCMVCVKSCPAGAIKGENWFPGIERSRLFDHEACSACMKEKFGHISPGKVCGICASRCPRGRIHKR